MPSERSELRGEGGEESEGREGSVGLCMGMAWVERLLMDWREGAIVDG